LTSDLFKNKNQSTNGKQMRGR